MNIEDIEKISDEISEEFHAKCEALAFKIREEILLPFCKKHQLTMQIGAYGDTFTDINHVETDELPDDWKQGDPDGGEYHCWHLSEWFGEEGAMVEKALKTEVCRNEIFDVMDIKFDITEEDIR